MWANFMMMKKSLQTTELEQQTIRATKINSTVISKL